MKITYLRDESVEIRADEIPFHALLRCIRRIPGVVVTVAAYNKMNDDAMIEIRFMDISISICTPFSDYIIECTPACEGGAFNEFIGKLRSYEMKWWERYF